jgi:type I restriction enzyme S subunit
VRFPLVLPSIAEQTAIAEFLDRETGKIDELVAEQRRLMELLKEKRQAVISHAVTRGLNPAAPLKPSGIEWLGDVPEHWETRTVAKASTKITNGFVGPTRDILVETGVPYIQATHIKGGRVNFDDAYFVKPEWSNAHAKSILASGDVLIVQTGAGTGDVGLVSEHEVGYNCHALIIVAPDESLLRGAFLSAVLQSTYGQQKLESIQTGAMHPHLNCGEVRFVEIPLPPLTEQADIVEHIRETAACFDTLTAEAQRAIDLLQERRTALISAAVTGQIDVRGGV